MLSRLENFLKYDKKTVLTSLYKISNQRVVDDFFYSLKATPHENKSETVEVPIVETVAVEEPAKDEEELTEDSNKQDEEKLVDENNIQEEDDPISKYVTEESLSAFLKQYFPPALDKFDKLLAVNRNKLISNFRVKIDGEDVDNFFINFKSEKK